MNDKISKAYLKMLNESTVRSNTPSWSDHDELADYFSSYDRGAGSKWKNDPNVSDTSENANKARMLAHANKFAERYGFEHTFTDVKNEGGKLQWQTE